MNKRNIPLRGSYFVLFLAIFSPILGIELTKLIDTGYFIQWESLGSPPGGGVEILGADRSRVYVRTNEGETYACSIGPDLPCWTQAVWPPEPPLQVTLSLDEDIFRIRSLPGQIADSMALTAFEPHAHKMETKYVLLADGNVWRWSFSVNTMDFHQFFYPIVCGIGGLILGLAAHHFANKPETQKPAANSPHSP